VIWALSCDPESGQWFGFICCYFETWAIYFTSQKNH